MYLSLQEVAESFGVSEHVVISWVRDEGMPHTPDRNRLLFKRDDVVAWAESRGLGAQAGFLARGLDASALNLSALLRAGGIRRAVAPENVTSEMVSTVLALPGLDPDASDLLARRIRMPGGIVWAAVGEGYALPHLSTRVALGRGRGFVALLMLAGPVPLPEPPGDGIPVTKLLFFVAPTPRAHLDLLARLTQLLRNETFLEAVMMDASDDEIHRVVASFDAMARESRNERGS